MSLKREFAKAGAYMVLGAALFGWATYPAPEVTGEVPPEVGILTDESATWTTEVATLRAEVARLNAEQAKALAGKYGSALGQAVGRVAVAPKLGTIAPNSGTAFPSAEPAREWTLEEVAAGLESGAILPLAERTFGPGPRGDLIDVLAVLPCDGCGTELVGKWADPKPLRHPRWAVEKRRFVEIAAAYTTSGPGAVIVGGIDGIRVRRVTLGLRGGGVVAADPIAWVGVSIRADFD